MTRWQGLGAFVDSGENLPEDNIRAFAQAGGKWIVFVLYNGGDTADWNRAHFPQLRSMCARYGVEACGWFNYFGEQPGMFGIGVGKVVTDLALPMIVLDCEASVQGNTLMSEVALAVAKHVSPLIDRGISTNSMNDSVVWNGRRDGVPQIEWRSVRHFGYRLLPQWYSSPAYGWGSNPWTTPHLNMQWLAAHGDEDNLRDETFKNKRAIPLSYVHPTIEGTGIEGADLTAELDELALCHAQALLSPGFSYYLLERAPVDDFALIAQRRGVLYLA